MFAVLDALTGRASGFPPGKRMMTPKTGNPPDLPLKTTGVWGESRLDPFHTVYGINKPEAPLIAKWVSIP